MQQLKNLTFFSISKNILNGKRLLKQLMPGLDVQRTFRLSSRRPQMPFLKKNITTSKNFILFYIASLLQLKFN